LVERAGEDIEEPGDHVIGVYAPIVAAPTTRPLDSACSRRRLAGAPCRTSWRRSPSPTPTAAARWTTPANSAPTWVRSAHGGAGRSPGRGEPPSRPPCNRSRSRLNAGRRTVADGPWSTLALRREDTPHAGAARFALQEVLQVLLVDVDPVVGT